MPISAVPLGRGASLPVSRTTAGWQADATGTLTLYRRSPSRCPAGIPTIPFDANTSGRLRPQRRLRRRFHWLDLVVRIAVVIRISPGFPHRRLVDSLAIPLAHNCVTMTRSWQSPLRENIFPGWRRLYLDTSQRPYTNNGPHWDHALNWGEVDDSRFGVYS